MNKERIQNRWAAAVAAAAADVAAAAAAANKRIACTCARQIYL